MPRQPFLTVLSGREAGSVNFSATALADNPLMGQIAQAISSWSHAEAALCHLLSTAVSSDAEVIAPIYAELVMGGQHGKVLNALMLERVSDENYSIFRAIKKIHDRRASERHDLAHGLWGACPGIP